MQGCCTKFKQKPLKYKFGDDPRTPKLQVIYKIHNYYCSHQCRFFTAYSLNSGDNSVGDPQVHNNNRWCQFRWLKGYTTTTGYTNVGDFQNTQQFQVIPVLVKLKIHNNYSLYQCRRCRVHNNYRWYPFRWFTEYLHNNYMWYQCWWYLEYTAIQVIPVPVIYRVPTQQLQVIL